MDDDKEFLKIGEVADMIGCSTSTLRVWQKSGVLVPDFIRDSGHRLYLRESVNRFIKGLEVSDESVGV